MYLRAISIIAFALPIACAQAPPSNQSGPKPKFDVASVKPCDSRVTRNTFAGSSGPGRVDYTCQTLMTYIIGAYGRWANGRLVRGNIPINVEGGPHWINIATCTRSTRKRRANQVSQSQPDQ